MIGPAFPAVDNPTASRDNTAVRPCPKRGTNALVTGAAAGHQHRAYVALGRRHFARESKTALQPTRYYFSTEERWPLGS